MEITIDIIKTSIVNNIEYLNIFIFDYLNLNYTDLETAYIKIIVYSAEWKLGDEPYYPINDDKNAALYQEYKKLADNEKNVIFGGRLAEYKYYDMDAVIDSALKVADQILQ